MMLSPEMYLAEYENASYLELLKLKNELVQDISEFETDYEQKNLGWGICPQPDVQYQWNLEVLRDVLLMLKEAFNKEYEQGEKDLSAYYSEMRNNTQVQKASWE